MSMDRRKDAIKTVNSWDVLHYVKDEISPFLAHAHQGMGSVKLRRLDRNASLRGSSSNSGPILQKSTPYSCLLGASSHSAGCSAKFPTIQKNTNHLVPSEHDTTAHASCLCWWKRNVAEPRELLSAGDLPSKGLAFNPLSSAHRALDDWPFRLVILTTQTSGFGGTVEQLVIVKLCKRVETCAVHQQQVVMFPKEPHLTLFPPPTTTTSMVMCRQVF